MKNGPGTTESTVTLPQSYLISKCAPAEESNFNPYTSTEIDSPKLVACDTMNFWIEGKNDSLMKIVSLIDILIINDAELCSLAEDKNLLTAAKKIRDLGPSTLVVKRGEFGAILFHKEEIFQGKY